MIVNKYQEKTRPMKKNYIYFALLFLPFLLISFRYSPPKYCRLSNKIVNEYNKELTKQKGLYLIGEGGAFMNDIQEVSLSYISYDASSVDQARRLYVEIAEGYLRRYNENVEIRPFLHNYPFTIDNLELMIGFEDETNRHRGDGYIALMFIARDKLWYKGYDKEKQEFYPIHSETYAKAVEIVRNEQ